MHLLDAGRAQGGSLRAKSQGRTTLFLLFNKRHFETPIALIQEAKAPGTAQIVGRVTLKILLWLPLKLA
jgi:hypothetical protein